MDAWGEVTTMSNTKLFAEPNNLNLKSQSTKTSTLLDSEQLAPLSGCNMHSGCSITQQIHATAPSQAQPITEVKTTASHTAADSSTSMTYLASSDSALSTNSAKASTAISSAKEESAYHTSASNSSISHCSTENNLNADAVAQTTSDADSSNQTNTDADTVDKNTSDADSVNQTSTITDSSAQTSSTAGGKNNSVNKSKPLIASNVSSMLNFFSAQMKTIEKTDTAHAQKINNFIDCYLATGYAAQKKNKALSELDLSNTLNSTKAKAAEVAAHMKVEQADLILSPFLQAPEQISFTNILPLQAFSSMTTFLDNDLEIEPLNSHKAAASAASKLTISSPTTMQESVITHCANDLGSNDLDVNDLGSNDLKANTAEANKQLSFNQANCSIDNREPNTAVKHSAATNQASSHQSCTDGQEHNHNTVENAGLQVANLKSEPDSTTLSDPQTSTVIPYLKNGSHYIQVSTEGLMDQLDPEAFLQQPIDTLDIFKDQTALSSSSTYILHDKSVLKSDLYNKRQSSNKSHEPFGEISSVVMPNELHTILNHVIKNHERYRHNAHPELLSCVGYWCYDREEGGFSIDKATAHLLGIKNYQELIPMEKLWEFFEPRHAEKIIYNHENVEAGMVFTDRLRLISGPYAGLTMIAQGSAVLRDPETEKVLISSGLLCFEGCPQAEFLFREITGDGMFVWNAENDSVLFSSSYHAMLGYTKNEFPTTFTGFCQQLVHPDDYDSLLIQQHIVRSPAYGNSFETCIRLKHRNGNYLWTIGRGLVLERNSKGVATQLIGSQTNIDIVHQSFDTINSLMFTDSLTELHNRSYFTQNAVRYEHIQHYPMSIIFVDVTGLKLTNDILGHNFGDYLILKCAIGMLQALQTVFAKTRMYTDLREQLSLIIDNMTRKAFNLIYQDPEQFNQAEKMFTTANNKIRASYPTIKNTSVVSFAEDDDKHPTLKLQMDTIEKMLKNKMHPEVIRLAGDELILLFPSCPIELAQMLKHEIISAARKMNALDRLSFPNETRPVPLCFGIGVATVGEAGQNDNFKQTLERADMRMLENKEQNNEQNHRILKDYFEKRLNREVSMRDSRRETILNASERQELRNQKMKESGGYTLTPPKPESVKIKPNLQLCE